MSMPTPIAVLPPPSDFGSVVARGTPTRSAATRVETPRPVRSA